MVRSSRRFGRRRTLPDAPNADEASDFGIEIHIEEGEGVFTLELDGRRETIRIARDGDRFFLHLRGRTLEVRALDPLEEARGAARAERGEELVVAPMPGVNTSPG